MSALGPPWGLPSAMRYEGTRGDPLKRVLGVGLVFAALTSARADAPRPEELMVGTPPSADRLVTRANAIEWPFSVWSFQHMERLSPSTTVDRGDGAVSAFASEPADLSSFSFKDVAGKQRSVAQFLEDQHIDAVVVWSNGKLRQEIYRNGENRCAAATLSCSRSRSRSRASSRRC